MKKYPILISALGLLAAFGAGFLTAHRQPREPSVASVAVPIGAPAEPTPQATSLVRGSVPDPAVPVRCDDSGLRKRIERLETTLRAQKDSLHKEGARIAFPENARPQDTPEGFKKLIEEVVAKCNPALEVRDLDCSEFPCIAWTRLDGTKSKTFDLGGCEPWMTAYDKPPISLLATNASDGGTGDVYVAFYASPSDASARKPVKLRAQERLDAMLEAYGVQ